MTLAYIYVNHGEALEADFFRFYGGLDINTCSIRRMRNLYQRLPTGCETNYDAAETPREARMWDMNTYMLANIIDAVQAMDWHLIAANSKRPPKPPKPFKRPELKKKEVKPRGVWPGKTIVENR